jgi:TolB-like protein
MSLFRELKRRNVFRVGIAYVVGAWILVQVGDVMFEAFSAPEWAMRGLIIALAIGLPLFLIGAWALELTPEGVKWESEVDRSQSIAGNTGKKLNNFILVLALIAVAYLLFDKFYLQDAITGGTHDTAALPANISRQSIAVLPFDNRSNLDADEFFVEGIHDDLLTNLSRIGDLKVISRTTVSQYQDTAKTIPEIAAELGVANIMEGAVQRSGSTVRINVQLIDAATDKHLWAEIFDREMTADNLFGIQTEISQAIARALASELTSGEVDRIADHPTDNLEAYHAYLRGRQALTLNTSTGADRALVEFRQAVERDPEFALGWVGLAFAAGQGMQYSDLNLKEAADIATEAVDRALAINDQLGEAYLAKSDLFNLLNDPFNAENEVALQRALELIPGSAKAWLSYSKYLVGFDHRMDEALDAARKAAELDPLSVEIRNQVVVALARSGRQEEAETQLLNLIALNPEFARNYETMSNLLADRGRFAEALHWQRQAQRKDPGNILFTSDEVYLLTTMGMEEEYAGLVERVDILDPNSSTVAFVETMINLRSENLDGALESVDAYIAALSGANPMIHTFRGVILSFQGRDEEAIASARGSFPQLPPPEILAQSMSEYPQRACPIAWLLANGGETAHGDAIARATIDHFNSNIQPNQKQQLRLGVGICQMLLGANDEAIANVVNAVEGRKLNMWWMELMHPAYNGLAMDPAFLQAREFIDAYMADQREQFRAIAVEGDS